MRNIKFVKCYIRGSVHRNSRLKKSNEMQQCADLVTFEEACSPDSMICSKGCNYSFMYS